MDYYNCIPMFSGSCWSRLVDRCKSASETHPSISPGKNSIRFFDASKNISCFKFPIDWEKLRKFVNIKILSY